LRQAKGYIKTEVECESVEDGQYRVRNFWARHHEFEIFRERFAEDFNRFDRQVTDELVEKQEFVGTYYEADGDDSISA
jgi:hypothetical protein